MRGRHGHWFFSEIMPSFAEARAPAEQIDKVIQYLEASAPSRAGLWSEVNLPRAMATEKAFPEPRRAVLRHHVQCHRSRGRFPGLRMEAPHIGVKEPVRLSAPLSFQKQDTGTWFGGVRVNCSQFKRVMAHSSKGSIFALQGELIFPPETPPLAWGGRDRVQTFMAHSARGCLRKLRTGDGRCRSALTY
jgi:hypothetical protein